MTTRELFNYWKNELLGISRELTFKEVISDENSNNEEFFFFTNYSKKYSFYIFCDNWGIGIGIHNSISKNSNIVYLNDIGIFNESNKLEFVLKALKDVVLGAKMFSKNSDEDFYIIFNNCNEINNDFKFKIENEYSIYELNEEKNRLTIAST